MATGQVAAARVDNIDAPDPDGYMSKCKRLPKGHAIATVHAEIVLLDRVKALLDEHYDKVFQEEWQRKSLLGQGAEDEDAPEPKVRKRRASHRVDLRVLEAKAACRYEAFSLPSAVKAILSRPSDETVWSNLDRVAKIVLDKADGLSTIVLSDEASLVAFRDAGGADTASMLTIDVEMDGVFLEKGMRVISHISAATTAPVEIKLQRADWIGVPLTDFGVELQKNALRKHPVSLQNLAQLWSQAGTSRPALTQTDVFAFLLLDLGLTLWAEQVWRWQRMEKTWTSESKIVSCIGWYLKGQHVTHLFFEIVFC